MPELVHGSAGQFELVLKGHGFQPCRNCHKINVNFSRWGNVDSKPVLDKPVNVPSVSDFLVSITGSPPSY
jgi:hypothetical protein